MPKTKIAIHGAAGRMGQTLIQCAEKSDNLVISACYESPDSGQLDKDAGQYGPAGEGITISALSDADADFDVLIDFTRPAPSLVAAEFCREHEKPIVIGTTGYSSEDQQQLQKVAAEIAVVMAPNFSIGVNLCLQLIEQAAKVIGNDSDIEVIGAHHRQKVDSPSGTALAMGKAAADALGRNLDDVAVYGREGQHGVRADDEIGFVTIHAGDIVGEHTVMFAGQGERVEITHKATDRAIFARGALRAAQWVAGKSPGLYTMQEVLQVRKSH